MTDLQALILGVLQGATEWLPISSTAHLRFVPALLGWSDPGAAFTAISQWGTVLAAIVYFRRDIVGIITGRGGTGAADRRLLLPIVAGTIPIIVAAVLLKDYIVGDWRSLYVVAGSMIGFGLVLAFAEARHSARRELGDIRLADGLAVGIGQAFALIPGASRSGSTMTAALLMGIERSTAARFSFLLSLPAVALAGVEELWSHRDAIAASGDARPMVIATVAAFVVGLATIHWLLGFLRSHSTYGFVVYRVVVGAIILAVVFMGRVPAEDPATRAGVRAGANHAAPAPVQSRPGS